MRRANALVAAACLASLGSPAHGEKICYRDYPDANRGRQIGGALLLNREDKAWLLEPTLTEVIAKGAGEMREVSTSPWAPKRLQPTRIDQLPIEELVARCDDAKVAAADGASFELVGPALLIGGDLPEFVEPAAFDAEADEGFSLAAEGRSTR